MGASTVVAEYPPEIELLICCASDPLGESDDQRLPALLGRDLDWPTLIRAAERHAVLPLVCHRLADFDDVIPSDVTDRLRQAYELNALRNSLLGRELCSLLAIFSQDEIPVIGFKGPALSLALYDNLLLRQFGDLDLFIHISDLERTTELLKTHGYKLSLSRRQQKYFLKHRYHYSFLREDGKVVAEIHWAFTPQHWPFPLSEEHLWSRITSVALGDAQIPCLSPDHTLLVLCAHGAKERWARLQLVTDVSQLIRRYDIDWDWVLAEAQRMGRERVLLLGIALAENLLGAGLPKSIRERINQDATVTDLVGQLRKSFFSDHDWPLTGMRLHRYHFRVWPDRRDRIGYVGEEVRRLPQKLKDLFTPGESDQDAWQLPHRMRFLHYILRPLRLAYAYRNPKHLLRRLRSFFSLS